MSSVLKRRMSDSDPSLTNRSRLASATSIQSLANDAQTKKSESTQPPMSTIDAKPLRSQLLASSMPAINLIEPSPSPDGQYVHEIPTDIRKESSVSSPPSPRSASPISSRPSSTTSWGMMSRLSNGFRSPTSRRKSSFVGRTKSNGYEYQSPKLSRKSISAQSIGAPSNFIHVGHMAEDMSVDGSLFQPEKDNSRPNSVTSHNALSSSRNSKRSSSTQSEARETPTVATSLADLEIEDFKQMIVDIKNFFSGKHHKKTKDLCKLLITKKHALDETCAIDILTTLSEQGVLRCVLLPGRNYVSADEPDQRWAFVAEMATNGYLMSAILASSMLSLKSSSGVTRTISVDTLSSDSSWRSEASPFRRNSRASLKSNYADDNVSTTSTEFSRTTTTTTDNAPPHPHARFNTHTTAIVDTNTKDTESSPPRVGREASHIGRETSHIGREAPRVGDTHKNNGVLRRQQQRALLHGRQQQQQHGDQEISSLPSSRHQQASSEQAQHVSPSKQRQQQRQQHHHLSPQQQQHHHHDHDHDHDHNHGLEERVLSNSKRFHESIDFDSVAEALHTFMGDNDIDSFNDDDDEDDDDSVGDGGGRVRRRRRARSSIVSLDAHVTLDRNELRTAITTALENLSDAMDDRTPALDVANERLDSVRKTINLIDSWTSLEENEDAKLSQSVRHTKAHMEILRSKDKSISKEIRYWNNNPARISELFQDIASEYLNEIKVSNRKITEVGLKCEDLDHVVAAYQSSVDDAVSRNVDKVREVQHHQHQMETFQHWDTWISSFIMKPILYKIIKFAALGIGQGVLIVLGLVNTAFFMKRTTSAMTTPVTWYFMFLKSQSKISRVRLCVVGGMGVCFVLFWLVMLVYRRTSCLGMFLLSCLFLIVYNNTKKNAVMNCPTQ